MSDDPPPANWDAVVALVEDMTFKDNKPVYALTNSVGKVTIDMLPLKTPGDGIEDFTNPFTHTCLV